LSARDKYIVTRDKVNDKYFFDCRIWPKCVDDRHRGGINDDLDRDRDDGVDLLCCEPLLRLKEVYYSRTHYGTHIYTCTYKYYGMKNYRSGIANRT